MPADTHTVLADLLDRRILIIDGAMGTMIQRYKLDEAAYRGERFENFAVPGHEIHVKGNNELLTLTQPHVIREIHEQYLAACADLVETNTFGATSIALERLVDPNFRCTIPSGVQWRRSADENPSAQIADVSFSLSAASFSARTAYSAQPPPKSAKP